MATLPHPTPGPARVLSFPPAPIRRLTIHTAGRAPLLGRLDGHRFTPTRLGELTRQYWLNLPLDYPGFGFDMFAVLPDRFDALVRIPLAPGGHDLLRGVVAHFKARVARAADPGVRVWMAGFEAEPVATVAGFLAARQELVEAALMVAGRRGYCPAPPPLRVK